MKMRPVIPCGQATLTDGRTGRRTERPIYDDANSRFSQFYERDALAYSGCNTTSHRNSTSGRYERLGTDSTSEVVQPGLTARLVMISKLYGMLRSHADTASQNNLKKTQTIFFTVQNTVCSRDSGRVPMELRQ